MAAPTPAVRAIVLERDHNRCVRCGRTTALQMHHRVRVGAGGHKHSPSPLELATACGWDNEGFEASLQTEALVYGMKVQTWADPAVVPMFDRPAGKWFLLLGSGRRVALTVDAAIEQMRTVYGPEKWDAWADQLAHPIGLKGRVA